MSLNILLEEAKKYELESNYITFSKNKNIWLKESKIGGVPYFPEWIDFPVYEDTRNYEYVEWVKLQLLAQINLSDIKSSIGPKSWILQFFINPINECYYEGFWDDISENKNEFKVIYHPDISIPPQSEEEILNNYDELGLDPIYLFNDLQESIKMSFDHTYTDSINWLSLESTYIKEKFKNTSPNFEELVQEFDSVLQENNYISKVYWNHDIVQRDIRINNNDDSILLLELSLYDMFEWDSHHEGFLYFFITKSDLINNNFNNVIFDYQC